MQATFNFKNKRGCKDEQIKVHQSLILGRSHSSGIVIDDEKISSGHCRITFKSDRIEIVDLDSKNGTYLNGIRIEQSELFLGDEVRIGETILTFNESQMSAEIKEQLTFPGPLKDRIGFELKADFTGARVQNLLYLKEHPGEVNSTFKAREISVRKQAHSRIRLTKSEIKQQHRVLSLASLFIDTVLLISFILIPIILLQQFSDAGPVKIGFMDYTGEDIVRNRIRLLTIFEIVLVGLYMLFNLRVMTYSVGEKMSGIEDLHRRQ